MTIRLCGGKPGLNFQFSPRKNNVTKSLSLEDVNRENAAQTIQGRKKVMKECQDVKEQRRFSSVLTFFLQLLAFLKSTIYCDFFFILNNYSIS